MSSVSDSDRDRFEELFNKLDKNKDGKIEVNELAIGLKSVRGIQDVGQHAQVMLRLLSSSNIYPNYLSSDFIIFSLIKDNVCSLYMRGYVKI